MQTWYNMTDGKNATISIFDGIGEGGVSAKSFINDLRNVKAPTVAVEINSLGGDVFAGLAIHNSLRNSGKQINVKVLGVAASAASLVAMAGDHIEMPANTFMMMHNPWTCAAGDSEELRSTASLLDKIESSLVSTYANRSGKTREEVSAMLDAVTWFTAEEAVAAGFATKVTGAISVSAKFDLDRVPDNVKAIFAKATAPVVEPQAEAAPVALAFSEVLARMADSAGMAEYAAGWVLDATLNSMEAVSARVNQAREVQALCRITGHPELAAGFIQGNKSIDEVRAAIIAARAEQDESTVVSTVRKISSDQPQDGQPRVVNTADYWAAYHKSQGALK